MPLLNRCLALLLVSLVPSASALAEPPPWLNAPDGSAMVPFRGVVDADALKATPQSMLYPGPGVVGLLTGVLTHAVLESNRQRSEHRKQQEDADKVLEPHKEALSRFQLTDLYRSAGALVRIDTASAPRSVQLSTMPTYSMTQDGKALVLDVAVAVDGAREALAIRTISQPVVDADPVAHWRSENGAVLRRESASLLAHALEMALQARSGGSSGPEPHQVNIRYRMGGDEKLERAAVLASPCARKVIRNLRGGLMSVPVRADPGTNGVPCEPALPDWH